MLPKSFVTSPVVHKFSELKHSKFIPWCNLKEHTLSGANNEFPIRDRIAALLLDIAEMLGYPDEAIEILQEVKVAGVRPDLVIVFKIGRFVGAIEVKQPFASGQTSAKISGEIFDQLMHLRTVYCCTTPLVVLSTYDMWQVFWLNDPPSNNVAASAPTLVEKENEPSPPRSPRSPRVGRLEEGKMLAFFKTPTKQCERAQDDETSPPPNAFKSPSKTLRRRRDVSIEEGEGEEEEELKRELCHSEEYLYNGIDTKSVIHLLCAVISKLAHVQLLEVASCDGNLEAYACLTHRESFQWKHVKRKTGLSFKPIATVQSF
jgi:hypothetical protein